MHLLHNNMMISCVFFTHHDFVSCINHVYYTFSYLIINNHIRVQSCILNVADFVIFYSVFSAIFLTIILCLNFKRLLLFLIIPVICDVMAPTLTGEEDSLVFIAITC